MKKASILSVILAMLCSMLSAQTPQETWLDYEDDANGEGRIFKTEYGYITFCGYVPAENNHLGVLVTGLSPDHEVLFNKPLVSDTINYGMSYGQGVIKANDFGFYQMLLNFSDENYGCQMLIRYNDEGDTLWTKKYFLDSPWRYRDFVLAQHTDGSLYLAGDKDDNPANVNDIYDRKLFLMKLDSEGNIIWTHIHDDYIALWNYSILLTEDAIVVGGRMFLNNFDISIYEGYSRDYIHKFDYNGESIWRTTINAPPHGSQAGVYGLLEGPDNTYIYGTGRSLGTLSGSGEQSNTQTAPTIGLINATTGDTISEQSFNVHEVWQQIFNLKKTNDGGYIAVGTHVFYETSYSGPVGFIMKLDENLELEWYRYYVPSIWEGIAKWNNLTDIVENDNGTFTALGMIYTQTGDGPMFGGYVQDTYLLTVDNFGCLIPGCETAVEEFELDIDISIYPNPTKDIININLPQFSDWEITLLNAQNQVLIQNYTQNTKSESLNLSQFTSGVYFLKCTNEKGMQYLKRVIVE